MMDYNYIVKNFKTPLYIFNIDELIKRTRYLKEIFQCGIVYAVKANTFIPKEIEDEVERFEICSSGEFEICNKLGINHKKMVISGVYKDYESIDNMISNYDIGKYTIESLEQFKLLEELSNKYNKEIHVLIRLTSNNQFGVNEEDFKYIIKNKNQIIIDGIEYFSGTQKTSLKKINREIDYLCEFINGIEEEFNIKLDEIEYGPGLSINYFQNEEFNEENYFKEINEAIGKLRYKKLYLETGRSLTASCGFYLTRVVDMKNNKNGNHVILDGGINHLVYYGQTMAMRLPYFDIFPKKDVKKEIYTLYGSLCTVNDVIIKGVEIQKLEIGDLLIFKNVGAYSSTEGISLFLSRELPGVVLYKDSKFKQVRLNLKTSEINCPNYEK